MLNVSGAISPTPQYKDCINANTNRLNITVWVTVYCI